MDSGDWLSSVLLTMTPHPYGSPLYILLGKALNVLPFNIVNSMTVVLSVLPAAVTVGLVYEVVKKAVSVSTPFGKHKDTLCRKLTKETHNVALVTSLVVMGCAVFLTQATVLESYSLTIMLLTAAVYFHQRGNTRLWLLMLGLGTAVHIIIGVITLAWMVIEKNRWQTWASHLWIFALSGFAPYLYTLWTMSLDTPKLFGGGLSLDGILTWAGGTDRIGTLAVVDAPKRIWQLGLVMLSSFGLALIPMMKGIRERNGLKLGLLSFSVVFIAVFLYVTNLDFTTWTYLLFGLPFFAIFIGYGLTKMKRYQVQAVLVSAITLITFNAYFLNAHLATAAEPMAQQYEAALMSVEDGAAILIPSGSTTGSGFFYVMSKKDLIPIVLNANPPNVNYKAYTEQVNRKYQLEGNTTLELTQDALLKSIPVYFAGPLTPFWDKAFDVRGEGPLLRVWGLNMKPDWSDEEIKGNR